MAGMDVFLVMKRLLIPNREAVTLAAFLAAVQRHGRLPALAPEGVGGLSATPLQALVSAIVRHLPRSDSSTRPTSPPYAAATRLSKKASYSTPITVA